MSKYRYMLILILLISISLVSCASQSARSEMSEAVPVYDEMEMPAAAPMQMEKNVDMEEMADNFAMAEADGEVSTLYSGGSSDTGVNNAAIQATGKRIVIKNANLSIVVDDPTQSMAQIVSMAEEMGGFTVNSELYKTTTKNGIEVPEGNITVRVPADKLNEALDNIKSLTEDQTTDILVENISGQDVTKEYTDLTSRLNNLESAQKQLEMIMADAKKTEDVLSVYQELSSVNQEIEVIKGQIKYYDETSTLSAISIRLIAQESVEPLTIGKWEPKGIARDAIQALIEALKFFINAIIWIILFFIPVIIILAIPVVLIIFLMRKAIKRRKNKSQLTKKTIDASIQDK